MTVQKPKNIPKSPGVYIFRGKSGQPLYVGKAGNLKSRLSFYFRKEASRGARTERLLEEASRVSVIKTESEIEALVKEARLIKTFRPKYNILMRDDKNYLFVVVTRGYFPRIVLTHQPKTFALSAKIIGPFTDAIAVKTTLKMLRRIFPYCTCKISHKGLCLNAELGKCPGPCCTKPVNPVRNRGRAIKRNVLSAHQNLSAITKRGADFFRPRPISNGMNTNELRALRITKDAYRKNIKAIVSILEGEKIRALKAGIKKELARASAGLEYEKAACLRDQLHGLEEILLHRPIVTRAALEGVKPWENLELKIKSLAKSASAVRRVEGYDISNISGAEASGSMVVFANGVPDKNEYRRFRIKTVTGANDIAMMAEVIGRRFRRYEWSDPDLIILDGGKPQLNAVLKKFKTERIKTKAVITALAKRDEELYVAGRKKPVRLKREDRGLLHFFQRVRDEAHRYAKKYHHKLREMELKKHSGL
ncbi:MAG: GIY-YIG nuclease family protein [Candidatus Sungiibacteriota bacterium]